jgi:hypothetical protein
MELGKFHKHGLNDSFAYRLQGTKPATLFSFTEKKKFVRPHAGMQSAQTANAPAWAPITVQVGPLGVGMR